MPTGKLDTYRRRRDSKRTPEPVPADAADQPAGSGNSFVIQEHHARIRDLRRRHPGR